MRHFLIPRAAPKRTVESLCFSLGNQMKTRPNVVVSSLLSIITGSDIADGCRSQTVSCRRHSIDALLCVQIYTSIPSPSVTIRPQACIWGNLIDEVFLSFRMFFSCYLFCYLFYPGFHLCILLYFIQASVIFGEALSEP